MFITVERVCLYSQEISNPAMNVRYAAREVMSKGFNINQALCPELRCEVGVQVSRYSRTRNDSLSRTRNVSWARPTILRIKRLGRVKCPLSASSLLLVLSRWIVVRWANGNIDTGRRCLLNWSDRECIARWVKGQSSESIPIQSIASERSKTPVCRKVTSV